jgi:hypothetical protein
VHPIQLTVAYSERQSRLTTFFRYFTALPHVIVMQVWAIPVLFVSFAAWFAILFTGSYPVGMWSFAARWLRYAGRVNGYGALLADGFPPFNGDEPYAISVTAERQERLSRLTSFFRGIWIIPAYVVLYIFSIGAAVVTIVLWFAIIFTGRAPLGMHRFVARVQRYSIRFTAYYLLLTDVYPSFEEPPAPVATDAVAAW